MKISKITLCFLFAFFYLSSGFVTASDTHDHHNHLEHKKASHDDHSHESEREHFHHDEHNEHKITLTQEAQELGGIKVMPLTVNPFFQGVKATGRIVQDVENVYYLTSPRPGVVHECIKHLGNKVEKDELICLIRLNNSKEIVEIKAPGAGIITADFIDVGDRVDSVTPIHTISDFSHLPASLDVYEKDIRHIEVGQKVNIFATAFPDEKFEGKVVFISPRVDESTFTTKIRVLIDNQKLILKPGMSVSAEILSFDDQSFLTVPSEAVQIIEGRKTIFIQEDESTFVPKEVQVHSENNNQVGIKAGVKEGERIVVNGAFILKSKMLESEMEHGHSH